MLFENFHSQETRIIMGRYENKRFYPDVEDLRLAVRKVREASGPVIVSDEFLDDHFKRGHSGFLLLRRNDAPVSIDNGINMEISAAARLDMIFRAAQIYLTHGWWPVHYFDSDCHRKIDIYASDGTSVVPDALILLIGHFLSILKTERLEFSNKPLFLDQECKPVNTRFTPEGQHIRESVINAILAGTQERLFSIRSDFVFSNISTKIAVQSLALEVAFNYGIDLPMFLHPDNSFDYSELLLTAKSASMFNSLIPFELKIIKHTHTGNDICYS